MKKLSIKLLDELAKNQQRISELEMKSFVGGGSGTADDRYSLAEMESLMDSGQWTGGYVDYLGYVSFSPHIYGSYYGGFCNQYSGNFAELLLTFVSSGLDQITDKGKGMFPLIGLALDLWEQEYEDCKHTLFSDLSNLGYADPEQQITFVVTPGSYSSETTDWSIIMGAYDAVTGELLVKYRMGNFGSYERIQ